MIYVNQEGVSESDFVELLEKTKSLLYFEFEEKGIPVDMKGIGFESIVYDKMTTACIDTNFYGHIEQTGPLSFPDIVARQLYGVEVKMTVGDKWLSTGNSVLETTRIESVQTIYMLFGKFGKTFEIKYRKYEECLYEVGVTHSPRYKIDMNLPLGQSIFDKIGVSYHEFRKEDAPIKRLKEYYRKQLKEGEELWWIDPSSEEVTASPVIKTFRLLDKHIREKFILECMILFPEIFGKSTTKFDRPAAYLITHYNAVSSNLRDPFTAGGTMSIPIDGKPVVVSRILYHLYMSAKNIVEVINEIPEDKLNYYWNIKSKKNRIDEWGSLLNKHHPMAQNVFNNGQRKVAQ